MAPWHIHNVLLVHQLTYCAGTPIMSQISCSTKQHDSDKVCLLPNSVLGYLKAISWFNRTGTLNLRYYSAFFNMSLWIALRQLRSRERLVSI